MASLMKSQYDSGNVHKINTYIQFPIVSGMEIIENPYTFFNNGPDSSTFETVEKICTEIQTRDFDIAIISCGACSALIGEYIHTKMGKDVILIGHDLLLMMGIKTGRHTQKNPTFKYNDFWVSVPDYLKPNNFMKIENGCYW